MSHVGDLRRRAIRERIRINGHVEVVTLSAELGVSAETIRRDLKQLERQLVVRRHHGGATAIENTEFESSLEMRSGSRVLEKRRIAEATLSLIGDADTLFLDEGFTPYLVAEQLATLNRKITAVTASLQIASMLATRSQHSVILLGGVVRGRTLGTVEHWATTMLDQFNFGLAIVGANGISRNGGLTTPDARVAAVKAAAFNAAQRRIFVGVHTKFGVTGFCRFGQVADLEAIVTETALPRREAQFYAALGPQVIRT